MDRKSVYVSLIILAVLFLGVAGVMAQEPEEESQASPNNISAAAKLNSKISYQGVLKENNTLVTGNRDMIFYFYTDDSCATPVQTIPHNSVPVNGGVFSLNLNINPAYFDGQGVWLRVVVSGANLVNCQEIIAVPYALSLRPGAEVIGASPDNSTIYAYNTATTGSSSGLSGLSNSPSGNGVFGEATAASGATNGVFGRSISPNGRGVFGRATSSSGAAYGVYGLSNSTEGRGVYGENTATTGVANGVHGKSVSPGGNGVFGEATALSGINNGVQGRSASPQGNGVVGQATATSGLAYGVYGVSSSTSGRGLSGEATAANGTTYGVHGASDSTSGRGVYGEATAATGATYGVQGISNSTSGQGVYGEATAPTGTTYGVHGVSDSDAGRGVFGEVTAPTGVTRGVAGNSSSTEGRGVHGFASAATGITYGVYGASNSTSGRGVFGVTNANTGVTYGVYGESRSPSGYGGFFYNNSSGVALKAQNASSTTTHIIEAHSASDMEFYVDSQGNVVIDGIFSTAGADFAEMLPAVEGLEPGDVLTINQAGNLTRSLQPYQTNVVGVYSTQPGFLGGATEAETIGQVPLAMIGRVPVKVSAENGPIQPGDLLVASSTPGHAMKTSANPPAGSVIGKAMAPLAEGTGLIQMLVMLQ